jgi:hypothetical protein
MASEQRPWKRQREDFWRAHHEAWKRSDLNQRQYCELHGLPQKASRTGARCSGSNRSPHSASCFIGAGP